jgi:hypothetical protein
VQNCNNIPKNERKNRVEDEEWFQKAEWEHDSKTKKINSFQKGNL